jgi:elongation of very long chain fatty acids protein 6
MFSKFPELIDTLFIVLRKKKLIFLHYYHHASVIYITLIGYTANNNGLGRWVIAMNYTVHSVMYSYYTLKAMKIRVPLGISKLITTLQILQMIIGIAICGYASVLKARKQSCDNDTVVLILSILVYCSYFVLFLNFYFKAYFVPQKTVNIKNN